MLRKKFAPILYFEVLIAFDKVCFDTMPSWDERLGQPGQHGTFLGWIYEEGVSTIGWSVFWFTENVSEFFVIIAGDGK